MRPQLTPPEPSPSILGLGTCRVFRREGCFSHDQPESDKTDSYLPIVANMGHGITHGVCGGGKGSLVAGGWGLSKVVISHEDHQAKKTGKRLGRER